MRGIRPSGMYPRAEQHVEDHIRPAERIQIARLARVRRAVRPPRQQPRIPRRHHARKDAGQRGKRPARKHHHIIAKRVLGHETGPRDLRPGQAAEQIRRREPQDVAIRPAPDHVGEHRPAAAFAVLDQRLQPGELVIHLEHVRADMRRQQPADHRLRLCLHRNDGVAGRVDYGAYRRSIDASLAEQQLERLWIGLLERVGVAFLGLEPLHDVVRQGALQPARMAPRGIDARIPDRDDDRRPARPAEMRLDGGPDRLEPAELPRNRQHRPHRRRVRGAGVLGWPAGQPAGLDGEQPAQAQRVRRAGAGPGVVRPARRRPAQRYDVVVHHAPEPGPRARHPLQQAGSQAFEQGGIHE